MIDDNTQVTVFNLNDGAISYTIPELNVRREFSPNEKKDISAKELRALSYMPGGLALIKDYLSVDNSELLKEFGLNMDDTPEYFWTNEDVKSALLDKPLAVLQDALDFAPQGVIDKIKDMAIELRVPDMNKRAAISERTGANIDATIKNIQLEEAALDAPEIKEEKKERRVAVEKSAEKTEGRRIIRRVETNNK